MKFNKKGFTLIELLVVIAIIALLSTLAVISLLGARKDARDSKRLADLKTMQTALENYANDNGSYPIVANGASALWTELQTSLASYITTLPTDPTGTGTRVYTYCGNNVSGKGTKYLLYTTMEGTDAVDADLDDATLSGDYLVTECVNDADDNTNVPEALPATCADAGAASVICLGTK